VASLKQKPEYVGKQRGNENMIGLSRDLDAFRSGRPFEGAWRSHEFDANPAVQPENMDKDQPRGLCSEQIRMLEILTCS
jgi:hypothetical protein